MINLNRISSIFILKWLFIVYLCFSYTQPDERGSGADSGTEGTNYPSMSGTLGRSGVRNIPGANDIMTEMARKLKERKAKAEGVPEVCTNRINTELLSLY